MTTWSWPKQGDIVRHTQSKRVVKVLRVGDTIDARTAHAADAHPDFPNVNPVDLEEAANEDHVRFILAEMKTGKVLLVGNSKNNRRFTVTFEQEVDGELFKRLGERFDDVRITGKAADLCLKAEPPAEAAPLTTQSVTLSPEAKAQLKAEPGLTDADFESDHDEPAPDKDALIAELKARIEKLTEKIDDLRDERDSAIAMADAADQRAQDFAEQTDSPSAFPLVRCMEVTTLYHPVGLSLEQKTSDAELARYLSEGWDKFDCAIVSNPNELTMRVVTLVRVQPAPQPAERKAAYKIVEQTAALAETRATLTAMADDPAVSVYDFNRQVLASRLPRAEKDALTLQRRQLVGAQIAVRRPAAPSYPSSPFRLIAPGATS